MKINYIAKKLFLFLILISSFNSFAQNSGTFGSYAIINQGSNTYYYGSNNDGINPALSSHDFGSLNSTSTFILNGSELSTWQKNGDEASGARVHYHLYTQGNSDKGDVHTIDLTMISEEDTGSSINRKWSKSDANTDLLSGLADGNYVLEFWFEGLFYWGGDTNNAFSLWDNNSGNNYIATFSFAGAPTSSTIDAITFEPLFPSLDEQLKITFRSNEGNQAMKDELEAYIHTGLNSNWTPSSTWLDNDAKYKLTKLADNKFQLTIADLRAYFGVDASFTANEMNIIFRNIDGSKQAKDVDNNDFSIPIYDSICM